MPVRAQAMPGFISTQFTRRDPVELEESSESRNATPSTPPPGGGGELEALRKKQQSLQEPIDAMQAPHRLQAEQAELQERIRLAEAKAVAVLAEIDSREISNEEDKWITEQQID